MNCCTRFTLLAFVLFFYLPFCAPFGGSRSYAAGITFDAILKAGLEVDTNPRRLNGIDAQSELLERWFVETTTRSQQAEQLLTAIVRLGAKRYHETSEEDTLVVDVLGGYQRRLLERLVLGMWLSARDRTERDHIRDYLRVDGRLNLAWQWSDSGSSLQLAPRIEAFQYKPDERLSNLSLGLGISLNWRMSEGLTLASGYNIIGREYRHRQLLSDGGILRYYEEQARVDTSHFWSLALSLRYSFMASLELMLHRNTSNSHGKELTRMIARLTAAVPLWLGLIFNGQATLQRTTFDVAMILDDSFAIDDENRNSLVLALSRNLWGSLAVECRYSWYSQEFGGEESVYDRHLFYLGLVADLGE